MDKKNQKQLIIEIINDDSKDGLYKQQTAVDWLANEILKLNGINDIAIPDNLFDQAKQMERELSFNDFKAGQDSMTEGGKSFDQYYVQTYKQ